jgi:hypothetical protein
MQVDTPYSRSGPCSTPKRRRPCSTLLCFNLCGPAGVDDEDDLLDSSHLSPPTKQLSLSRTGSFILETNNETVKLEEQDEREREEVDGTEDSAEQEQLQEQQEQHADDQAQDRAQDDQALDQTHSLRVQRKQPLGNLTDVPSSTRIQDLEDSFVTNPDRIVSPSKSKSQSPSQSPSPSSSKTNKEVPAWHKDRIDCPQLKAKSPTKKRRNYKQQQGQQRPSILEQLEQDELELDLSREQKMVLEVFFNTSQHNQFEGITANTTSRAFNSNNDTFNNGSNGNSQRPKRISIQEPDDHNSNSNNSDINDKSKPEREEYSNETIQQPQSQDYSSTNVNANVNVNALPTNTASTTPPTPTPTPTPPTKNTVRFTTVTIREYPMTVGDNPSTTRGVPLTVEWDHDREYMLQVDDFERVRPARRNIAELQTQSLDRIRMLKNTGWSGADLKKQAQHVNAARLQRQQTRTRVQIKGWCRLEEGWERIVRSIRNQTMRRNYKRWERQWLAQFQEE